MEMALFTTVLLLVSIATADSYRSCRTLGDCACSEQCVRAGSEKKCSLLDRSCVCKEGCGVFDEFIPLGQVRKEVYGNMCRCPDPIRRTSTGLLPLCTRAAWFPQPEGIPESESHPGCTEPDSQSSEEQQMPDNWYQQIQQQIH